MNNLNTFFKRLIILTIQSLVFIGISTSIILAQSNNFCLTVPGENAIVESACDLDPPSTPIYLKIAIHVVRQASGTGGQSVEGVEEALSFLNADFNPHNIFFVRDCYEIDYIDVDSLYWNPQEALFEVNSHQDAIDLYLCRDTDSTFRGLAEGIPSSAFYTHGNLNKFPFASLTRSSAISHEMGHCLGLYHTFHQTDIDGCTFLANEEGETCGDMVCDTPPTPNLDFNVIYPSCEWEPEYPEDQFNFNGMPYTIRTDLIMGYTNFSCMTTFTDGQVERMRHIIYTSPVLQSCIVEEPLFYGNDNIISTNTTWTVDNTPNNGNVLIEEELVITCNATLRIEEGVNVRFANTGKLIVTQGATLILEGTLTSEFSYDSWRGVEIWGHTTESQNYVNGELNQGRILTYPGAVIENAEIGVKLWGTSFQENAGGIINANQTTFRNNRIAVEFAPYSANNYSAVFNQCDFITDNDYPQSQKFWTFLRLVEVNGVQVRGCNFDNQQTNSSNNSVGDQGFGILSFQSGFSAEAACLSSTYPCSNYQRSSFSGLGYGIYNIAYGSKTKAYKIKQADFTDNYFGAYINSVSNGTILFNNFNLGNVPNIGISDEQVGIMFENDMGGFTMEENDFVASSGNVATSLGSVCKNLGRFNNLIRQNTYNGVDIANLALGENAAPSESATRGLSYLCNDNSNAEIFDFYASNQEGSILIRTEQGLENGDNPDIITYDATGNKFSYGNGFDFGNAGIGLNYYYDEFGLNQTPISFTNLNAIEADENGCPASYCEPPCRTEMQLLSEKTKYYNDAIKKDLALFEKEQATLEGNTTLALEKEKEAAYYRRKMDKEAFMVVLHIVNEPTSINQDSLALWLSNLDLFSFDMFSSIQAQSEGDIVTAQRYLETASKRRSLTKRERKTLEEIPNLLKVIERKPIRSLNKSDLAILERIAEDDYSFVGNVSRNILTFHGYQFTPKIELPDLQEELLELRGNNSNSFNKEILIYPNPAQDYITISRKTTNLDKKEVFKILDTSGRIVKEFSLSSGEDRTLETSDFRSGLYFYQLFSSDNTIITGKFLIQ